ncbi:MAG: TIM barrel protein [Nitrospiraceae bacterium]|nr:TIM barrel protein [Nitrospiraceae bacterium]
MGKLPYALQLYTVREPLEKDVPGTLAAVREIGYKYVEVAGTAGLSNADFKRQLDWADLKAICVHVGYDQVVGDVPGVIETAHTLGAEAVAIGGIDAKLTPDKEGWAACGRALDASGARLREAGITLAYHNHAHEFDQIDGEYPLDILFNAATPENLGAELDTYWVKYARLNPVSFIERYKGRCPLLHVKDMLDTKSRAFAEVGRGIIAWPPIFEAAEAAGARWLIVEQDVCANDPIESAAESAAFMAKH